MHQTFEYAVLACALRDAAARHADWTVVEHERLCTDPVVHSGRWRSASGSTWSDAATAYLTESDRDGTGYETQRRAQDQPDRWKERLDATQVATIRDTLTRFPESLMPDEGS